MDGWEVHLYATKGNVATLMIDQYFFGMSKFSHAKKTSDRQMSGTQVALCKCWALLCITPRNGEEQSRIGRANRTFH